MRCHIVGSKPVGPALLVHLEVLGYARHHEVPEPEDLGPVTVADPADVVHTVMSDAVSYDSGYTHTEFILTPPGPELVEINPRLGGVLIGESLCRAHDHNIYRAAVDMAPRWRSTVCGCCAPTPANRRCTRSTVHKRQRMAASPTAPTTAARSRS